MSRIGNKPIAILDGVKVNIDGQTVAIEGPKGKLSYDFRPEVNIEVDGNEVKVSRHKDDSSSSMNGT